MKMSDAFPSKYINAADLQGKPIVLTMGQCQMETMGDGKSIPVLYFQGAQKGLGLNKTNGSTISALYGDDSEGWLGRPVELYPTTTEYQGKVMPCVRVRQPSQAPAAAPAAPVQQPVPVPDAPPAGGADEIPF